MVFSIFSHIPIDTFSISLPFPSLHIPFLLFPFPSLPFPSLMQRAVDEAIVSVRTNAATNTANTATDAGGWLELKLKEFPDFPGTSAAAASSPVSNYIPLFMVRIAFLSSFH